MFLAQAPPQVLIQRNTKLKKTLKRNRMDRLIHQYLLGYRSKFFSNKKYSTLEKYFDL